MVENRQKDTQMRPGTTKRTSTLEVDTLHPPYFRRAKTITIIFQHGEKRRDAKERPEKYWHPSTISIRGQAHGMIRIAH